MAITARDFAMAGGSTIGRDHRVVPKNNQDAWAVYEHDRFPVVAVVADGCGSGQHSEVGAGIGARLVCNAVTRELMATRGEIRWPKVEGDVLSILHAVALSMGGNFRSVVEDHFLFTIVGVAFERSGYVTFFAIGDGVIVINDNEPIRLRPAEGNKPAYLGYRLLDGWDLDVDPGELYFRKLTSVPINELSSFLIGCDGVNDLEHVANHQIPGFRGGMEVGGLSQFWEHDANFSNPAAISRRLKIIGRDWKGDAGLLPDDTTLVVGRRCRL